MTKPLRKTAAWYLFKANISGAVDAIHVADENMLELRGVITTMNEEWDAAMAKEQVSVYWTPAMIVEKFAEGVDFKFWDTKTDMLMIYNKITEHFHDCRRYFDEEVWVPNERKTRMLADLKLFDRFQDVMYEHVVHFLPPEEKRNNLSNFLDDLNVSGLGFEEKKGTVETARRKPLAEILGRHYR